MNCVTCGNWIAKATKFNARKETANGLEYLGIRVFRFYIRCPRCSAEITFRTDPQNTDYVCEQGAIRNFEPWKDNRLSAEEVTAERAAEEENNPMKALENRAVDSKREMDILDALDEIRTRNAVNERVDAEALLDKLIERKKKESGEDDEELLQQLLEEEDEAYAKSIFGSGPASGASSTTRPEGSGPTSVKRLAEEDGSDEEAVFKKLKSKFGAGTDLEPSFAKPAAKPQPTIKSVPLVVPKKAKLEQLVVKKPAAKADTPAKPQPAASVLGGLADYDSDEEASD